MIVHVDPIAEDEGNLEIKLVPMPNSFLIQLSSDIIRGTFVMDHSLEREDLNEVMDKIFNFIDELSMRSLTHEEEIPQ
jgi:hypothetical protein